MNRPRIVDIFITHVDCDGPLLRIWGQIDRSTVIFVERLILQQAPNFERGIGVPSPKSLHVGDLCCAKYGEDGAYYRARISNVDSLSSGKVAVQFVDFGNCEVVPVDSIRYLTSIPGQLHTIPDQAEEFLLAGIVPISNSWDTSGVRLIRHTLCYVELKAIIVSENCKRRLLLILYQQVDFAEVLINKRLGIGIALSSQEALVNRILGNIDASGSSCIAPYQDVPVSKISKENQSRTEKNNSSEHQGIAKILSAPVLEVNSEHDVRISHIENGPAAFSVQLFVTEEVMKRMTMSLNDLSPRPIMEPLHPGSVCLGRSIKKKLCRAVVVKMLDNECVLYFVDIGNSETVPYSDIYDLPKDYWSTGSLALNFTLSGIKGIIIDDTVKQMFQTIVGTNVLKLHIVPPEGPPIKQYAELFLRGRNVLNLLLDEVQKVRIKQCYPLLASPRIGTLSSVKVTYISNISDFYVQLTSNSGELATIMSCVESYCNGMAEDVPRIQLCKGMPVCARYVADGKWYRAKIISVNANSVSVLYVDYGNIDTVPLKSLKQMEPVLSKMHAQCVACRLLECVDAKNSEQQLLRFEMETVNKTLTMKVVEYDEKGRMLVQLLDASFIPPTNIGEKIMQLSKLHYDETGYMSNKAERNANGWQRHMTNDAVSGKNEHTQNSHELEASKSGDSRGISWQKKGAPVWQQEAGECSGSTQQKDLNWPQDAASRSGKTRKEDKKQRGGENREFGDASLSHHCGETDKTSKHNQKIESEQKWIGHGKKETASVRNWSGRKTGSHEEKGVSDGKRKEDREIVKNWSSLEGNEKKCTDFGDSNKHRPREKKDVHAKKKSTCNQDLSHHKHHQKVSTAAHSKGDIGSHNSLSHVRIQKSEPKSFPPVLILRDKEDAELAYGSDPCNFVIQVLSTRSQLSALRESITAKYSDEGHALCASSLKVGFCCIARYPEDQQWYRGYVKSVDGSFAEIYFVDHGNIGRISMADLREIMPEFLKIPILGVPCNLACAHPKANEWTAEEIDKFMNLIESKQLRAYFNQWKDDKVDVVLKVVEDGIEMSTSVNEMFGASAKDVEGLIAKSKFRYPLLQIPPSVKKVEVTWFISPEHFYCQFMSEAHDRFVKMVIAIQKYYQGRQPLTSAVPKGSAVIARFPADEVLYRAIVKEVKNENVCIVQYVDYGNCEALNVADIWPMDPQFMELPPQAVLCCLKGVKPSGTEWPKISDAFDSYFANEDLSCIFHCFTGDKYVVSLYKNEVSVADELLKCGLVEKDIDQDHPPYNIQLFHGQQLAAHVTYIEGTRQFFVQVEPLQAKILQAKVQGLENKVPYEMDRWQEDGRFFCLATVDGMHWYRGQIISLSSNAAAGIHFIDFGDCATVPVSNICAIPHRFIGPCNFVLECSVFGAEQCAVPPDLEKLFKLEVEDQDVILLVEEVVKERLAVRLFDIEGQRLELLNSISDSSVLEVEPLCPLPVLRASVKACISHVTNSSTLWIQRVSDGGLLAQLVDHMYSFYEENVHGQTFIVEENQLCAAKSLNDSNWYRARITSVSAENISVFFMDYGNLEVVPTSNVKALDPIFFSPHCFALCTSLCAAMKDKGVCAQLLTKVVGEESITVEFQERIENTWIVNMKTENSSIDLHCLLIDNDLVFPLKNEGLSVLQEKQHKPVLEMKDTELGVCLSYVVSPTEFWVQEESAAPDLQIIADTLQGADTFPKLQNVQKGMLCAAVFDEDGLWYRALITQIVEDSIFVYFIDYGNSAKYVNHEHLRKIPENLVNVPPLAKCCSLLLPETIETWPCGAKELLIAISGDGVTKFKLKVVSEGNPQIVSLFQYDTDVAQIILKNCTMLDNGFINTQGAFISYVNSPGDFWVQFLKEMSDLGQVTEGVGTGEALPPLTEIKEGALCAAIFPADGQWYRAKINFSTEEGTEVYFIDYGNTSISSNLRSLPQELLEIPPLAKHCCLPLPERWLSWPKEACEEFLKITKDDLNMIELTVLQDGNPAVVSLTYKELKVENILESKCVGNQHCNVISNDISLVENQLQYENETPELTEKVRETDLVSKSVVSAGDPEDSSPLLSPKLDLQVDINCSQSDACGLEDKHIVKSDIDVDTEKTFQNDHEEHHCEVDQDIDHDVQPGDLCDEENVIDVIEKNLTAFNVAPAIECNMYCKLTSEVEDTGIDTSSSMIEGINCQEGENNFDVKCIVKSSSLGEIAEFAAGLGDTPVPDNRSNVVSKSESLLQGVVDIEQKLSGTTKTSRQVGISHMPDVEIPIAMKHSEQIVQDLLVELKTPVADRPETDELKGVCFKGETSCKVTSHDEDQTKK